MHASELQYVIDKILSTVQIHTQEFEDISAELINCILECPLMKLNDGNPLVLGQFNMLFIHLYHVMLQESKEN